MGAVAPRRPETGLGVAGSRGLLENNGNKPSLGDCVTACKEGHVMPEILGRIRMLKPAQALASRT